MYFSWFWRLEVWGQAAIGFSAWWESTSLVINSPLFLLLPQVVEVWRMLSGVPFIRTLTPFLLILFMRFSRQECWGGLPFPSPVDHVLSELSTTIPLWTELNQEPWWRTIPPLPVKFSFLFSPEISIIATTSLSTWMYLKWIRVSSLTTRFPFQPLCYWSSTFLKTTLSSSSSFCMTSLSHAHHFLYYILWKLHHDI